jgi:hypothetical protein
VAAVQQEHKAVRALLGGWAAQNLAWASTSAVPEASSTAEAQGPSWCEPTITRSSSRPGSSPTTLLDVTSSTTESTVNRTLTGPCASWSRSQAPSAVPIHTPGMGRSIAS